MRVFQGFRGFYHARKSKAPMSLFWDWLKAKWIADLQDVFWLLVSIPLWVPAIIGILIQSFGLGLARLGEKICNFFIELKPGWMGSKRDYRRAQYNAADRYREFIGKRKP